MKTNIKVGITFVLVYVALWLIVGATLASGIHLLGHCYVLDCTSMYLLWPTLIVFFSPSLSWVNEISSTFATILILVIQTVWYFLAGFAVGGIIKKAQARG